MSGSDIQQLVTDRRTHYFLIVVTSLDTAQEVLQAQTQCCTFWQPHRKTFTYCIREHKQFHFLTNLTVVAFLGFFQHSQIFIQHFLFRESNTVNTSHLLTVFLSSPISTSYRKQLNSFNRSCAHQVRTTAQVGKCALCICSNMSVFQFRNQLALISFASFTEHFKRIFFRNALTYQSFFSGSQFFHLFLNSRQVTFLNHSFTRIYIIIETVFNGRTDTKLDTRIKFLQSFSQQVSTCMPECMLTLFIIPFIKNKFSILFNWAIQINSFAIYSTSQHILCKTRADTFCYLQTSNSFVIFTNRAIRKSYFYHTIMFLSFIKRKNIQFFLDFLFFIKKCYSCVTVNRFITL